MVRVKMPENNKAQDCVRDAIAMFTILNIQS